MDFKIIFIIALLSISFACALTYDGNLTYLNCQSNPNFNVNEKEYCVAEIPINYSNESFRCMSYVKYENRTIQVNPEYREKTDSLLSLNFKEQELREYFTPANYLVNVYYTKKNLHPGNKYIFGVICNSNLTSLNQETSVVMDYENFDFVFARMQWMIRNKQYIIGGLIVLILSITGLMIFWGAVK